MTALNSARNAYARSAAPVRTERGMEYDIFARVTRRLIAATDKGALGFPDLAGALHDNRCLWVALAADVAEPDNLLPEMLRARIFYLAEFTRLHSQKVLVGDADALALIDINKAIMRGLQSESVAQ